MSPDSRFDSPLARTKYVRAVGPRLRLLLYGIFGLVALLGANSVYLGSITFLQWLNKEVTYENYFYQFMFLAHLVLGLLLVLPVIIFGLIHIKNAHGRPNRRAVRVGYLLFTISLVLLFTGLALMRFDFFVVKNPNLRSSLYWSHVVTPVLAIWLYILHRLAGPRIKWQAGVRWGVAVGLVVISMVFLHSKHPRKNQIGSQEGEQYFHPSSARTASGKFIPARTLMMDDYCLKCHQDAYKGWFHSAHHFSSFNNKPYLFSVRETRQISLKRDGNVKASRWCAGCHDVVPFLSGAFDDPNYDLEKDPTSQAGITCTTCHAITHVNSTRGNADYTIDEPIHYPFAYSSNRMLQFINQQLVKAKPEFHKKTFLKPLHKEAEFCSTCHKVSLPIELTKYKDFLRGQNHYDTYLLSGVSGHSARSFYYPPQAQLNCNGCHMPLQASDDFGARFFSKTNHQLSIHNHLFPAANTGLAHIRGQPDIVKVQQAFLEGSLRVDLFGLREGGGIDGKLIAPLRPRIPTLQRGRKYLLEVVVRTLRLGHPFSQGTTDSNEIWVDTVVTSGSRVVGRSGALGAWNEVDPWSHFLNTYMLDREGNRIDRRNPQDIFTPLYNHQIPPGAAQVVHYELAVPKDTGGRLTVEVKLQYRKFDAKYMQYVFGKNFTNDLPITTIASDKITFAVQAGSEDTEVAGRGEASKPSPIPEWQRWNDYGIGLFLEGGERGVEKGELIQAGHAFAEVEKLGRPDGPLNLARVYFKEGRLEDTVAALQRAAKSDPPAPRWLIAWLNGQVNKQNGYLDKAITEFRSILEDRYLELDQRGFDFSKDYVVLDELGQTYFERAKLERNDPERQMSFLRLAAEQFKKTLALDSEDLAAHYNLSLIDAQLGDEKLAAEHRQLHERFRPDNNAADRAIAIERRRNPAADNAAKATVIYPLHRPGAPGLAIQQGSPPDLDRSSARTAFRVLK